MILVFILEYISILKQLPHFSSFLVFGTYPKFETITRVHVNVNFQAFNQLRNKPIFFDKVKYKQNRNNYYNTVILVRSIVKFLDRNFLFIDLIIQ